MARNVHAPTGFKPALGRLRVGHGLNGGEGFASDQKKGATGLEVRQGCGQFMAIHIADEMQTLARRGEGVQRQYRHLRPQIRAANADVDDVGDGGIRTHRFGVGQHGVQRAVHLG